MFKKQIFAYTSSWVILTGICAWLFQARTADLREAYYHLFNPYQEETKQAPFLGYQQRFQVNKTFLFTQGSDRLKWELNSRQSKLAFGPKDHLFELVEYFEDMQGVIQGEVDIAKQLIRTFKADQAIYHYKQEQLKAKEATLHYYAIPGRDIPTSFHPFTPYFSGKAQELEISFTHDNQQFKAKNCHMILQQREIDL